MIDCEFMYETDCEKTVEAVLDKAKSSIKKAINLEGIEDAEFCIAFTDDEGIRKLNKEYRDIDRPTDVLSFPANMLLKPISEYTDDEILELEKNPQTGAVSLGDIAISLDTASRQAEEYSNTLEEEIAFLAVHGILHLMGYDHMEEADEMKMRQRQRQALGRTEQE